jgi:hypothetical protein
MPKRKNQAETTTPAKKTKSSPKKGKNNGEEEISMCSQLMFDPFITPGA